MPIEPLETFITENLSTLSDPLSLILEHPPAPSPTIAFPPHTPNISSRRSPSTPSPSSASSPPPLSLSANIISKTSNGSPPPPPPLPPAREPVLPWVLEFSSDLYTKVIHYSLQKMVQDTEKVNVYILLFI